MITFIYFFVLLTSVGVLSLIDMIIYQHSLYWIIRVNIILQPGTAQWAIYTTLLAGLCYSVVMDFKNYKQRKQSRTS